MSDATLREAIEKSIASEGLAAAGQVGVLVRAGRVHLFGNVPSYAVRCGALQAARRIAGAHNVFVDLRVQPNGVGDEELAARARAIIRWSALVPEDSVTVAVAGGVLTLSGTLATRSQHQGLLAQMVPLAGLVDLVDRIAIGTSTGLLPLAARIRNALREHAGADAERVRFELADDGCVRIEGELSDWRSHRAIMDALRTLEGVRRIEDAITIDD